MTPAIPSLSQRLLQALNRRTRHRRRSRQAAHAAPVESLEGRVLLTIDLATALFAGWDDSIVVSNVAGTNTDSADFTTADTIFVDIGWGNFGDMSTGSKYTISLELDGAEIHAQSTGPHDSNFGDFREDIALSSLGTGAHTLTLSLDTLNEIAESDETNNVDTKTFTVTAVTDDFGDAPTAAQSGFAASYPTLASDGGASHGILAGFHLGPAIDGDADGQPSLLAADDDLRGVSHDEDGVTFDGPFIVGTDAAFDVELTNTANVTDPYLDVWVDFNRDGDWFDPGESVFSSVIEGSLTAPFTVDAGASYGNTYARFRLHNGTTALTPDGAAADGEVEDYLITLTAGAWGPLGPFSATDGQVENVSPNDEVVGAIHTVIAHPTNADILYLGGTNGGVWKTTNATAAGPNWIPISDGLPSQSIGALTFDLADPTFETVYAGIGRSSSFGRIGNDRIGLLRTADGGATMEVVDGAGALVGKNISGIHVNGDTIVVSVNVADDFTYSNIGIFRSTDGGATFTRISDADGTFTGLPGGVSYDLVADPSDPNILYTSVIFADGVGGENGIYKSVDEGATWSKVSDAAIDALLSNNTSNLEMSVGTSNNVYAGVINNGRLDGLFRSGDGGTSWVQMDTPATNENGTDVGLNPKGGKGPGPGATPEEIAGGQGNIHFSMLADPNDPNIVYVGGDRQPRAFGDQGGFPNSIGAFNFTGRLFRGDASAPVGSQFVHLTHSNSLGAAGGGTANSSAPHADSREMVFDASGDIIEVDDGGIYRRTNPQTNTGDWFSIIGDLQVTEAHDVAWDAVSNVAITGNQDTGTTFQPSEGAAVWDSLSTADGGDVAVDDITLAEGGRSIRYTSFQNLSSFRRTTWDTSGNRVATTFPALTVTSGAALTPAFRTPVELNAINPQRLVIQGGNSTYESLNQGSTIAEVGAGVFVSSILQNAIAYGGRKDGVDNEDVLWVGSSSDVFFRSGPGALAATAADPTTGTIRDLTIDPDDWASAFVIDSDQVFSTSNAGETWTDMTGNLLTLASNLRSIRYVAGSVVDAIVVGTNRGIFAAATDALETWIQLGADLPNVLVYDMEYDAADDVLITGTLGRGAWLLEGASSVTDTIFSKGRAIIVDDGDPGYWDTGDWEVMPAVQAQNGDERFAPAGIGTRVATFEFTGLIPGQNYEVSATWTTHPNRATNAPYTILDSDAVTILETTLVDQEQPPDDYTADGSDWEKLAVVTVSGTTLTVQLSNAADQYVIADAIRVVETEEMPPEVFIIDDGEEGYADSGWDLSPVPQGFRDDHRYRAAGSGAETASWTFTGLTPGHYRVSATWAPHANRATNAPFTILDGTEGLTLSTILVDQEQAPGDLIANGGPWDDLAVVTITGSELVVELSNAANEYVVADAIRIERSLTPPPPPPVIIDDGDAGYTDTGWEQSPLMQGRLNDLRYTPKGNGSNTATWTFTGLAPGHYRVSATWDPHPNRATNAPFTIYDGAGGDMLEMVRIDQERAPDDLVDNGSSWEDLAVVTITGTELVVQLSDDANQFVIADAIRVAPTADAPSLLPGTIIDDGEAGFSTSDGWNLSPMTEGRDGDVRYAGPGDGSKIATWTFTDLTNGTYRVSATWTTNANRAGDAPYTIFDGETAIVTVDVDQRAAPDDFNTLGSDWEDLTTEVAITTGMLRVELSNHANGFVIADAIRVQLVEESGGGGTNERLVLGPSDNLALDQPRVTVLLTEDLEGNRQVGPFTFNTFLLDTGANGILAMASAVSEMNDAPYVYQTEGEFAEQGVSGLSLFDISAPYYFYFAADGNGYVPGPPLEQTRILSNAFIDFSIFGPHGIAGMPLMDGRVTTLDFSGWSGGLDSDLGNIFMQTTFRDSLPDGQNRFAVPLDNRLRFDAEDGILTGDHPPTYSDIPFLTATMSNDGNHRTGNLVVDTGAQAGILSSEVGFELNLDSNGDGVLDPLDDNFVETLVVGGVGGEIEAHMFFIEEVSIPTEQGVDLVWTDLGWLILDIETPEGEPSIDGVFGSDLLTSGWVNAIFAQPPGPDGFIQQAHFDFREWAATGNGTLYLDLTTTQSAGGAVGEALTPAAASHLASSFSEFGSLHFDPGQGPIPGTALHRLLVEGINQDVSSDAGPVVATATASPPTGITIDNQHTGFADDDAQDLSATLERQDGIVRMSARDDDSNIATRTFIGLTVGLKRDSSTASRIHAKRATDEAFRLHRPNDFRDARAMRIDSHSHRQEQPEAHEPSSPPSAFHFSTAVSFLDLDEQQVTAHMLTDTLG